MGQKGGGMTPKEKAEDLWLGFYELLPDSVYSNEGAKAEAKKYALICVEEIINDTDSSSPFEGERLNYWQSVKTEIEKL